MLSNETHEEINRLSEKLAGMEAENSKLRLSVRQTDDLYLALEATSKQIQNIKALCAKFTEDFAKLEI